jgi:hypothetical protein
VTLPIARVAVHPDGAVVTREGRLPIVDGEVRVRALPLLLDPTSVRISLGGTPIRQVRVELDFEGEDRGPAPEEVDDWRRAREELTSLDVSIEAARAQRDALARLVPQVVPSPERDLPPPDRWLAWSAADRAIEARVGALDDELRALQRSREALVERIGILAHRVEAASSQSWWRRWEPLRRVRVEVAGEGEVPVELSYRIGGARWSPTYTLDADGALRGGRFAMRATIVQATGEDWRDVALTLTSAPSERRIDVPELAALRLGSAAPPVASGWRPLPADLDALFPSDLPIPPRPPAPPPPPALAPVAAEEADDEVTASLELDDLAPPDLPRQMPVPQAAPKSRGGGLGGLARALATPMSAAMSNAMPASAPAPARAPAPPAGSARPRDEPPAAEEVAQDLLDYGRLRLRPATAGPGLRGRLAPASDQDLLTEARAPREAGARLSETLERRRGDARRVSGAPMPPHHVLPAPIGGSDVRIDAVGRVDVPSDGLPHTVAVETWPVDLDVAYRAVPRLDPRAFRQVTATVPYERPLLPGPVEVYVDGRLELASPWAGSGGRGKLEIGLGAEDRLKLVRNVRYREETAGLFGGSRRLFTTVESRSPRRCRGRCRSRCWSGSRCRSRAARSRSRSSRPCRRSTRTGASPTGRSSTAGGGSAWRSRRAPRSARR